MPTARRASRACYVFLVMLVFLFLGALASARAQTGPSVNTTQGVVFGTYGNDGIANFYGIHYAGPATGSNRFKDPTPAPVYPGEYHAVYNNVICAQPTSRGLVGVEDCLVLSIHTRNLTASNPVIVWLEGEQYETTSTIAYSYDNLVKENVVFVSINYRLSIFGFLCLGVPEAPGNVGLKDVVQALTWIQQNIVGFGGNPNNVLLLGHGSGAAMVDLITMSPMAKGLVHKAIVLSGSALSPWAISYDPIEYAQAVGSKLGYTEKSNKELADLLITTDINILINTLTDFKFFNNTPLFAPCIENVNSNSTFLTDAPINILKSGNYSHIPYIAGYTNREGTVRAGEALFQNWLHEMDRNFTDFIQADLKFETASNKTDVAKKIREFYFAQRSIDMDTIQDFLDYQGDSLILIPVIRGARERALTSTADVRLFQFAYQRPHDPDWPYTQIPLTGVRHGGILSYIFDYNLDINAITPRRSLTARFTEFARTGSQSGYPNLTSWEPITPEVLHELNISGGEYSTNATLYKEEAKANLNGERSNFWNDIYATYYRVPTALSSASGAHLAFVVLIASLFVSLLSFN